jgi:hypothetical protein
VSGIVNLICFVRLKRWLSSTVVLSAALVVALGACGSRTMLLTDGDFGDDGGGGRTTDGSARDVGPDAPPDGGVDAPSALTCPERWAMMDMVPIVPPHGAAGIDLSGASGTGITVAEATAILCNGSDLGAVDGPGTEEEGWGTREEVQLVYDPVTGIANELTLRAGYTGSLDFHGGSHTYSVRIGSVLTKDGQPFTIDPSWGNAAFESQMTELYDALMETFPVDSDRACFGRACSYARLGAVAYFDMEDLDLQIWWNVDDSSVTTVTRIDLVL